MRPSYAAGTGALVAGLLVASAACSPATKPPSAVSPSATQRSPGTPRDTGASPHVVRTVARHLAVPWGLGFLPDGTALVTERESGRVLALAGTGERRVVTTVGQARPVGEAGLLGLAVSPHFSQDHRVFLYVTTASDNRVVRTTYDGSTLTHQTAVLTGIPNGFIHDGGRMAFGPDGYLYVSTGETGQESLAQDPDSWGGKILRITQDGDPAPGNPDSASPVWTLGHRNVQGLAFDNRGRMWASEFGDSTWDELNRIRAGDNYGWPRLEGRGHQPGYHDPVVQWHTDQASPSGLAFWQGSLWLASLRGERLWKVPVRRHGVGRPLDFFVGDYGRLRTVAVAPDGNLWVTTSNRDGRGSPTAADDRIIEVSVGAG